jgi:hypothetical protein
MPESSEYSKQIQAYALGCLDREEYSGLRAYLSSGEDYPWQELGEYQNLAALLPSILNMEMPSPVIKDNVARRLYRVRDEIKQKIGSNITSAKTYETAAENEEQGSPLNEINRVEEKYIPVQPLPEPEVQPELRQEDDFYSDVHLTEAAPHAEPVNEPKPEEAAKQEEFEVVKPVRHTSEFFISHDFNHEGSNSSSASGNAADDFYSESNPVNKSYTPEDKLQYIINEDTSSGGGKSPVIMYITVILLLLMLGGGVYAYLKITADVKSYKNEVGRLNKELKTLTAVPDVNKDFQKMMEMPDTKIVNLASTKLNPGGFGKVIINPTEGAGYLQFGGMPEQSFTLWITSGKNPISLGTFKGLPAVQYIRFDLPELNQKQRYFILVPEVPGAEKPGRQVYLYGEF